MDEGVEITDLPLTEILDNFETDPTCFGTGPTYFGTIPTILLVLSTFTQVPPIFTPSDLAPWMVHIFSNHYKISLHTLCNTTRYIIAMASSVYIRRSMCSLFFLLGW